MLASITIYQVFVKESLLNDHFFRDIYDLDRIAIPHEDSFYSYEDLICFTEPPGDRAIRTTSDQHIFFIVNFIFQIMQLIILLFRFQFSV